MSHAQVRAAFVALRQAEAEAERQRDAIARSCLPLVASLVGRYRGEEDPDECSSRAMVALANAIRLYDGRASVQFASYAGEAITNAIWKRGRDRPEVGGYDGVINATPGPEDPSEEVIAADERRRVQDLAHALLGKINARYQDVIRRRFGIGRPAQTLDEVAADLHLSRERIRQLQAHALIVLRVHAEREAEHRKPDLLPVTARQT
jgi:RNA polymerase sigma factor (sigma-70 family)